jgi:hypothetical protein
MSSDISAIEAVIQDYFDGLHEGDIPKLRNIFHETCTWYMRDGEAVSALPVSEWLDRLSQAPSAASRNLERIDRLLGIEIAEGELAFARLNVQIPPRYFTDFMTLVKLPDVGWKIVSKTFHAETRE